MMLRTDVGLACLLAAAAGLQGQSLLTLSPYEGTRTAAVMDLGDIDPTLGGLQAAPTARSLRTGGATSFAGTQVVFLDFDSQTDGTEHVYTTTERDAIEARIASTFSQFQYSFTQTAPASGTFATLIFNAGPDGGLADGVDFRNLNLGGSATINVNAFIGGTGEPPGTSANFIAGSANIGAHELGHLSGLRHGDSFGPIGTGRPSTGTPATTSYFPTSPVPANGTESATNLMASPASIGQPLANIFGNQLALSERSATKLAVGEQASVTSEAPGPKNTTATAQPLTLQTIDVPNTRRSGDANFGQNFTADVAVVTGTIGVAGEIDGYRFSGNAGDLINLEVMSNVLSRITDKIDPLVEILQSNGAGGTLTVPYYTSPNAFNHDEFESLDSILIDLVLPATSDYFIVVGADGEFGASLATGDYELYFSRFNVPEPGTAMLAVAGLGHLLVRRRAALR